MADVLETKAVRPQTDTIAPSDTGTSDNHRRSRSRSHSRSHSRSNRRNLDPNLQKSLPKAESHHSTDKSRPASTNQTPNEGEGPIGAVQGGPPNDIRYRDNRYRDRDYDRDRDRDRERERGNQNEYHGKRERENDNYGQGYGPGNGYRPSPSYGGDDRDGRGGGGRGPGGYGPSPEGIPNKQPRYDYNQGQGHGNQAQYQSRPRYEGGDGFRDRERGRDLREGYNNSGGNRFHGQGTGNGMGMQGQRREFRDERPRADNYGGQPGPSGPRFSQNEGIPRPAPADGYRDKGREFDRDGGRNTRDLRDRPAYGGPERGHGGWLGVRGPGNAREFGQERERDRNDFRDRGRDSGPGDVGRMPDRERGPDRGVRQSRFDQGPRVPPYASTGEPIGPGPVIVPKQDFGESAPPQGPPFRETERSRERADRPHFVENNRGIADNRGPELNQRGADPGERGRPREFEHNRDRRERDMQDHREPRDKNPTGDFTRERYIDRDRNNRDAPPDHRDRPPMMRDLREEIRSRPRGIGGPRNFGDRGGPNERQREPRQGEEGYVEPNFFDENGKYDINLSFRHRKCNRLDPRLGTCARKVCQFDPCYKIKCPNMFECSEFKNSGRCLRPRCGFKPCCFEDRRAWAAPDESREPQNQ